MTFMNDVVFSAIEAAAKPDDLSQPLGYLLMLLNDVVNANESAWPDAKPGVQKRTCRGRGYHATDRPHPRSRRSTALRVSSPLYFEPSETPDVSIIIPVHNKFSVTYDCLDSIVKAPSDRTFEIIIADDCSDDETLLAALVLAGGGADRAQYHQSRVRAGPATPERRWPEAGICSS